MAQYDLILTQNVHATEAEYSEKIVNIAKGDLLTANNVHVPTILSAGADGYILMRDDTETIGLKWVDPINFDITINDFSDNRIITATDAENVLDAEVNFTYDSINGMYIGSGTGITFANAAKTYSLHTQDGINKANIEISTGINSSGAAGDISLSPGTGASTGGNVYVRRDTIYGNIYFGTGASGHLPEKTSETNIIYYETTTGKLSYGTIPLVNYISWGTANNKYVVVGSALGDIQSSSAMVIMDDGNVGIGTTSPSYTLDVSGKIATDGIQTIYRPTLLIGTLILGDGGGSLDTGANYNTFVGIWAGLNNTTGTRNTANGYHSLSNNTTGQYNTANGYRSLHYNTEGSLNTANGMYSLGNNTTGTNNTANGSNSLISNTEGSYNTANGMYSLGNNTTGNFNTANGSNSLVSNTTGSYNTANGMFSLENNTTGSYNTANGSNSLVSNTTGSYNTANGMLSLENNTTGSYNTANGMYSGKEIANGGANETGSYSVFLGYDTRANADGETNQIVIGNQAVGEGSNSVVLGNDSITKTILKGNVGIGTTSPSYTLDVSGKIATDGIQTIYRPTFLTGTLILGDGGGSLETGANNNTFVGIRVGFSNTTGLSNTATGYVSLHNTTTGSYNTTAGYASLFNNTTGSYNTANGYQSLHYNTGSYNTAYGYMSLSFNTTGIRNTANGMYAGRRIATDAANETGSYSVFLGYDTRANADGETNQIVIGNQAVGEGSNSVVLGNDSITKTILKGNVGIGTTSPSYPLDVAGSGRFTDIVYMTGLGSNDTEDHVLAINDSTGLLSKRSVSSIGGGGASSLNDLSDVSNTSPADRHVLVYDGVTDNQYENRLLVEADISDLGNYSIVGHAHTFSDISDFSTGVSTYETSHSNVLIDGDFASAGLMKTDGSGGYSVITDNSTAWNLAEPNVQSDWNATTGDAFILNKPTIPTVLWTQSGTDLYYNNGNVGIGTTSPSEKLDVNGNISVTGTVTASSTMEATNFILSSDIRLKQNIVEINKKEIDVEYKQFELKSEPNQLRYGVIAQELEKVNPELVRTDKNGIKSVAYIDLLVMEIAALKSRIKKLEVNNVST